MSSREQKKTVRTRRLSPWRVILVISILPLTIGLAFYLWRETHIDTKISHNKPWFAPYVDVTATPQYNFDQLGATSHKDAVLSFIVAAKNNPCSPSWGSVYSLSEAGESLDLDRRIARLRQQGGTIAVSFGGVINDELATVCTDETKLTDAYREVINRYHVSTIDLDLEKGNLTDTVVNARRAKAIATIQQERAKTDNPLAVWLTLPVTSQGLNEDGTNAVKVMLTGSVDLAGVNIMTMNFSQDEVGNKSLAEVSKNAAKNTVRQLGVLYNQSDTYLNSGTLWRKLGMTPMIGQNETEGQVFTLDDARSLNLYAREKGAGRMSMWSANRDIECGANYLDVTIVSDACSGIKQEKNQFSLLLGDGFTGTIRGSSNTVTSSQKKPSSKDLQDDPATSPYPIWSKDNVYLQGTKVVWHHNVYQAKWWTKGDVPDNPVLQNWQTPWELVGPVLPGEKPIEQKTLPAGTYPEWSGDTAYEANQRVLFQGVPYQAKWWTKGDSPAASSSNSQASPWVPLTQSEVNQILQSTPPAAE